MKFLQRLATVCLVACGFNPSAQAEEKQYAADLVVYGDASGGVAAAVQAARMGNAKTCWCPGPYPRRTSRSVFMILGQSAATAACLAIEQNTSVQAVDYKQLRARLLKDNQRLVAE